MTALACLRDFGIFLVAKHASSERRYWCVVTPFVALLSDLVRRNVFVELLSDLVCRNAFVTLWSGLNLTVVRTVRSRRHYGKE